MYNQGLLPPFHFHRPPNLKRSGGFFGITHIWTLFGLPVAYRLRTRTSEEIRLAFGKRHARLWKRQLPMRFLTESVRNDAADAANLHEINRLCKGGTRALFVMDSLMAAGGVERRLELFFEYLVKAGIQPILVLERSAYKPLAKYTQLRLIYGAPNAGDKLIELVRLTGASIVEFNMKDVKLFHDVNLEALKRWARIGCMIHGGVVCDPERIERLDYVCAITNKTKPNRKDAAVVPNVVEFPSETPNYRPESDKALCVSRIDTEKLPTIRNFIAICRRYDLRFEIAGPVQHCPLVDRFLAETDPEAFLGVVDTRTFLQEHGSEYCFVAGVGQVPLEAAAANLPSLVATHLGDTMRSAFLTIENAARLVEYNCVIRTIPPEYVLGNVEAFFAARELVLSGAVPKALESFRVREHMKTLVDAEVVTKRYITLITGKIFS